MTNKIDQQMIRKAAIVVAELDPDAADALLDGFPEEIAQQVRYESMMVDDVPVEERRAVLTEFMQRRSGATAAKPEAHDELMLSSTVRQTASRAPAKAYDAKPTAPVPPPFHFLNDAPPEMLAPFFEQESPQVIAVVLSHLEPARASAILRELPIDMQATVIQRLVDLGHTDAEVLQDIESRLQSIVQDQLQAMSHRRIGLSAAKAILAASDEASSAEVLKALKTRSAAMALRLGAEERTAATTKEVTPEPLDAVYGDHSPIQPQRVSADIAAADGVVKKLAPKPPAAKIEPPIEPSLPLADFVKFDDVLLGRVLSEAEPQTVLLALAGASNAVAQRFYRGLSKREIHDLQRRIRDLQPVLIRDIDAAQKRLGTIAARVLSQVQQGGSRLSASA
ncbi:FliG C-terminal domain-containing protein [Blastopirellula marina]|uniref:Flagellar motor switch protein FliG n=1 Tax=Blastopirellula marina DSM 3645 TaxID=314230 RepID=A3ZNX3_9BACT|nr:FliG C-terminal domain-containing protein [Blastopirellula marina]EAQ82021.1 flagellar motor protein [Blastopirellula marina DSM 3645]